MALPFSHGSRNPRPAHARHVAVVGNLQACPTCVERGFLDRGVLPCKQGYSHNGDFSIQASSPCDRAGHSNWKKQFFSKKWTSHPCSLLKFAHNFTFANFWKAKSKSESTLCKNHTNASMTMNQNKLNLFLGDISQTTVNWECFIDPNPHLMANWECSNFFAWPNS